MKCPFTFTSSSARGDWSECDEDCALRVKTSKTNVEVDEVIVGETCALAANSCNLPGVTFVPAFIEVIDRIDISELMNYD